MRVLERRKHGVKLFVNDVLLSIPLLISILSRPDSGTRNDGEEYELRCKNLEQHFGGHGFGTSASRQVVGVSSSR